MLGVVLLFFLLCLALSFSFLSFGFVPTLLLCKTQLFSFNVLSFLLHPTARLEVKEVPVARVLVPLPLVVVPVVRENRVVVPVRFLLKLWQAYEKAGKGNPPHRPFTPRDAEDAEYWERMGKQEEEKRRKREEAKAAAEEEEERQKQKLRETLEKAVEDKERKEAEAKAKAEAEKKRKEEAAAKAKEEAAAAAEKEEKERKAAAGSRSSRGKEEDGSRGRSKEEGEEKDQGT